MITQSGLGSEWNKCLWAFSRVGYLFEQMVELASRGVGIAGKYDYRASR